MDPNKQKEQFQIAYVSALAAHAGINQGAFQVDDDSIDIVFQAKNYPPHCRIRNPQIQLQLKCTSQDLVSGSVIKFKLSLKNYEDLRGDNVVTPRYLALLVVPADASDWITHDPGSMSLRNECYWLSLRDLPATSSTTRVTVDVPLANRLHTDTLLAMMAAASMGDAL